MSWLNKEELKKFKSVGENVLISKDALIFGHENIEIGSNIRIDAMNLILASKGYLKIGSWVHLAAGSKYLCGGGIVIQDFAQVAFNCVLLSASDDFSGRHLIGPTVVAAFTDVTIAAIVMGEASVLGVGSILSPGTTLFRGAALGANSFTMKNQKLDENTIYAGSPAKPIKVRSKEHFDLMALVRADKNTS